MPDGSLAPVRCGASNSCDYCAFLAAVENAALVALDAREHSPPVGGMTTTTHRPDFDLGQLRRAEENLIDYLRRAYGKDVAYCGFLEWTTGKGGHGRMPHLHHLLKGIPREVLQAPERGLSPLEVEISKRWERYTGGAFIVDCRELRTAAGAIAYLSLHHHKREQAAPAGIKHTKRLRPSRNYFDGRIGPLRERVRSLTHDRRVRAAAEQIFMSDFADAMAAAEGSGDYSEAMQLYHHQEDELEQRFVRALEDAKHAPKPQLVSVHEYQRLDDNGELHREVVKVVGPL